MRAKAMISVLFIFSNLYSFAQPGLIQCSNQNNPDRSVSIYANSQGFVDYTLKLNFATLNGYTSRSLLTSNIALAIVNRGNTEVMKLAPDNSLNHSFQYRYQSFPGHSFTKMPDTSFQYLLPASSGNHIRITSNSSVISLISQKLGNQYRGTGFVYKLNDTICAARAGIVFETSDTVMIGEKTEEIYKSGRNKIRIEHRDGTIGNYGIIAPIKLLVAPGDEVFPGQPLAVFNKESPRYMAFFSTCYLDEKKLLMENNPDNTYYFIYMPIYFYGSENEKSGMLEKNKEYTVQQPRDIISKEMTKKEKKKFGY